MHIIYDCRKQIQYNIISLYTASTVVVAKLWYNNARMCSMIVHTDTQRTNKQRMAENRLFSQTVLIVENFTKFHKKSCEGRPGYEARHSSLY